jgi:hypothetical protein
VVEAATVTDSSAVTLPRVRDPIATYGLGHLSDEESGPYTVVDGALTWSCHRIYAAGLNLVREKISLGCDSTAARMLQLEGRY